MFTVRTLRAPEPGSPAGPGPRVETAAFDLEPALAQGRSVCNLFAEFLAQRPAEFRETLPFLNNCEMELQWAAASGGAAFWSFFHGGRALGMGVLLSGADDEADRQMLEAFSVSVLEPMLGQAAAFGERPGALMLVPPHSHPELDATMQLLTTALASVYFRAVRAMAGAA